MGTAKYVLYDTNVLLDLYHNARYANEEVAKIVGGLGACRLITYMEFMAGIPYRFRNDGKKFLASYLPLGTTAEVDATALQIATSAMLKSERHMPDCLIAAFAIAYEIPLLTANVKDFTDLNKNLQLIPYRSYSAYIQEGGGMLSEPEDPATHTP